MVLVGIGVISWSHIRAQHELSFEDIYILFVPPQAVGCFCPIVEEDYNRTNRALGGIRSIKVL